MDMTPIDMTRNHKRFSAAALALEATSRQLDRDTRLLVQLRSSFLNNCPYCIRLHSAEARNSGWDSSRIDLLRDTPTGAWPTSALSEDDVLLLEFTDIAVRLSEVDPSERDTVQERVVERFGSRRTGEIITAIVAITMWNRIAILSQK